MEYTAKEVSEILSKEGFYDITPRTVNYYAFEKKMFEPIQTGKKCFSESEIEKIKSIKTLQESTNFTLDQIKEIINKYSYDEILSRITPVSYKTLDEFDSGEYRVSSFCSLKQSRSNIPHTEENTPESGQIMLKVNDDIILTVSDNVDTETLAEIIKSIKGILKNKK